MAIKANSAFVPVPLPTITEEVVEDSGYEKANWLSRATKSFWPLVFTWLPNAPKIFALCSHTAFIQKNATRHSAIEAIYNYKISFEHGVVDGFFSHFWEKTVRNTAAVRNRLRLVKRELRHSLETIALQKRKANVMSLGSGSARAIIETLAWTKEGLAQLELRARLVDISRTALDYSRQLAGDYGVESQVDWVRGDFRKIEKHCQSQNFIPDIVEIVGLFDYFPDSVLVNLLAKIAGLFNQAGGGTLICGNIRGNPEKRFVTEVVKWPMIYREPRELVGLLVSAGFHNIHVIHEPMKVYTLARAKLDMPSHN